MKTKQRSGYREYPISWGHLFGIRSLQRPDCLAGIKQAQMLNEAILVQPGIAIKKLSRVFDAMIKNHDNLRMRFINRRGEWRAIIMDEHPLGMIIEDHGDVDDDAFKNILTEHAVTTFELDAPVMYEMRLLRFGKRGDVLLSKISHMVCDGYSMIILAEEFLMRVLAPFARIARGVSYEDYLKRYGMTDTEAQKKYGEYWRAHLLPVIEMPNIGRKAKHLVPNVDYIDGKELNIISIQQHRKDSSKFLSQCRKNKVTPYAAMTAAFSNTIMQKADCNAIYCNATIGRSDSFLDYYVGNHIFLSFFRCNRKKSTAELARIIQNRLTANMANLPNACAVPLYGLHDEIKAGGGFLGQFASRMLTPEGRIKRSPFATSYGDNFGATTRIGQLTISRLKLKSAENSISELSVGFNLQGSAANFELHYERAAYTKSEMSNFAMTFAENAALPNPQFLGLN
jgi:hypothetical protein